MQKTFLYPHHSDEEWMKIITDVWNTFSKEEQDEMIRKINVLKDLRNGNNFKTD